MWKTRRRPRRASEQRRRDPDEYDVIAVGRFRDTGEMNDQIKALLTDPDINESNTSVVLNAVTENEQFELPVEDD